MNPKTQIINYYNMFPKNRDFFLLDTEDNIKQFKNTTTNDPEYIYVLSENKKENKIHENIYKRRDFLSDYEFIRVNTNNSNVYINFLIPKKKFINGREIRLLTEIKQKKKYMKEIFRKTQINFDTKDNIIFKESFSVQNELKFYNRVFYFTITKQNFVPGPSNQRVNNNNNFAINNNNNNNYQNNNFNQGNNNNNILCNNGHHIIYNINKNDGPVKILPNRNPIFNNMDNNQDMNLQNGEFMNNNQGYNFNNINQNTTNNNNNNHNHNFPTQVDKSRKYSFEQSHNSSQQGQNFSKEVQSFISQGQQGHNQQPQQGQNQQSKQGQFYVQQGQNQPQPFQNLAQPYGEQNQPQGGPNQPYGGLNQPYGGQNQPYGGQNQSYGGQNQPYGGLDQPYGGQNQQYGGLDQQNGGQNQPYGGQNQPYGAQNQSYGEQNQPYGGQNQPYGGQNQSYGGQNQPYGAQNQSYGGQNQPYGGLNQQQGGQNQPYGGLNQQQGGQNQPYGGQHQQQGGQNLTYRGLNQQQGGQNLTYGGQNQQQGGQNQQQGGENPQVPNPPPKQNYIFPLKGLVNIGSTCYMNATLQCLLHVSELISYFIDEFPKDQPTLNKINNSIPSGGDISRVFYNLVIGVYDKPINMTNSKKNLKSQTNVNKKRSWNLFNGFSDNSFNKDYNNTFSPKDFKIALGLHNPQFKAFEANDSKDLILYLLQTLHEEMNYFGNKKIRLNYYPNQYDMLNTYQHFYTTYNSNNFSKISLLFYGTYINTTVCKKCNLKLYNFQKFEFISFGMYFYNNKEFNIMKGFEDNSKTGLLTGDNKFLCNNCKGLQDAETTCQICEPPNKLLINIDYGKNKKYQPSSIKFDEEIDITPFIASNLNMKFQYRIIGVCTHYGYSGRYGHYVAFCRHREEKVWYEFNDSIVSKCSQKDIYRGSPYLLLYERII